MSVFWLHRYIGRANGEWACLKCDRRERATGSYPPRGGYCIRRKRNWRRDPVTGRLR